MLTIGNVIRAPGGSVWIVTDVNDYGDKPTVSAVSFDTENVTAVQLLDDCIREYNCVYCWRYVEDDQSPWDADCEHCHGTGTYTKKIPGWKHSQVLAPTVQAFILNRLKKVMDLR